MTNIIGYRPLSDEEVALVNKIKAAGEPLKDLIGEVITKQAEITKEYGTPDAEAYRWAAIARTHLQEGLMALTRAVTKPETF